MDNGTDYQLIDVREPEECEICHIGGELIPLGEVMDNIHKIVRNKKVVVHCRSGGRSGNIIKALEMSHGFDNLYNLKGGIIAWAKEVDTSMTMY